jgi:hypothetical protein
MGIRARLGTQRYLPGDHGGLAHVQSLLCEELADVGKRLEFKCIACGIEKEHGRLLADLALEANVGFDDERDARAAQAIGERLPGLHRKHDAEVRNGNVVAVDGVVMGFAVGGDWLQMRDDLVAEEIEVDPLSGAAAFCAA